MGKPKTSMKIVAINKRATYDYEIGDRLIAGLVLHGPEVKSIKLKQASLKGGFIRLRSSEAYLHNAHITPYKPAAGIEQEAERPIKLLLHRRQLAKLVEQRAAGLMPIPMALGVAHGLIKLELGIGKPKKRYDKRESLKKAQAEREAKRRLAS